MEIGYDVDPVMINAVRRIQDMADVRLVSSTSDIADDSVDATFVISVFTHLDITTDDWLGELKRILKPGGRAFITFHDDTIYHHLHDSDGISHETPRNFRGRVTTGQGAQGSTPMVPFTRRRCRPGASAHRDRPRASGPARAVKLLTRHRFLTLVAPVSRREGGHRGRSRRRSRRRELARHLQTRLIHDV